MVKMKIFPWLLSSVLINPVIALDVRRDDCPPIHVFGARGTSEPPGFGIIGGYFVNETLNHFPGATAEPIVYPANGDPTTALSQYKASVQAGISNVTAQVSDFAQRCPQTKIVLVGYSQGAKIMDDALCGGGDPLMDYNNTAATIAQFNIKAVLLPGDDRFTVGEPFHIGNATKSGIDPRPDTQLRCGNYTDAIQLYCNDNDLYCANGTSLAVHLSYFPQYRYTALAFLQSRLGSNSSVANSTNSSMPTNAMPAPSTDVANIGQSLNAIDGVVWLSLLFCLLAYVS